MTKDILSSLEALRKRLNSSGIERTVGLRDAMGDNCAYYRKSRALFLDKDYQEIKSLLLETLEHLKALEGPNG